ncbi:MAG: HEPN domain-containing protein [Sulfuricurvum sp.]|uniref:HEPN domain-containing protein n=1 Tax=Sulfuricurvum sp. TaxID=2025608 RepID=UPI0025F2029F|nr:HEPN domain-containing protein [Sulfuricurvum sp.]MCK9371768.1 HEPN domain-containing protein [Sulfuricurvum sp.]
MKPLHNEWIEFAKRDYYTLKKLDGDEYLTNIVLFHSQQCIEKLFKGIMEASGADVPRIHNTKKLYELIADVIDQPMDVDDLLYIDSVYIESRYPASFGLLPGGQPTLKESQKAIEIVKKILSLLDLDFESRGGSDENIDIKNRRFSSRKSDVVFGTTQRCCHDRAIEK